MAQKMALVPPEMLNDIYRKPEIRVEDDIQELLERNNLADDQKVKLLSLLLSKYQRVIHKPKEPVRVSVVSSETESVPTTQPPLSPVATSPSVLSSENGDIILKQIKITVPSTYQKFIDPLVSLLKQSEYKWNKKGELVVNDQVIQGSNIIDLISYLMRSRKSVLSPVGFNIFWEGIKKINIPREWIGNKSLKAILDVKQPLEYQPRPVESPEEIFSTISPRIFYRWKTDSKKRKNRSGQIIKIYLL